MAHGGAGACPPRSGEKSRVSQMPKEVVRSEKFCKLRKIFYKSTNDLAHFAEKAVKAAPSPPALAGPDGPYPDVRASEGNIYRTRENAAEFCFAAIFERRKKMMKDKLFEEVWGKSSVEQSFTKIWQPARDPRFVGSSREKNPANVREFLDCAARDVGMPRLHAGEVHERCSDFCLQRELLFQFASNHLERRPGNIFPDLLVVEDNVSVDAF